MTCPIRPVWGRVVLKPHDVEETDPAYKAAKNAGLYIPEKEKNRDQIRQVEGELVAIGGDCFKDWQGLIPKVGDKVLYDEYAGSNKTFNNVKYQIVNDTDIIGILEQGYNNE